MNPFPEMLPWCMEDFPQWILYEDENLLVLDKPGWLVCHPSKNGPWSSLVGAAKEYLQLKRSSC